MEKCTLEVKGEMNCVLTCCNRYFTMREVAITPLIGRVSLATSTDSNHTSDQKSRKKDLSFFNFSGRAQGDGRSRQPPRVTHLSLTDQTL